MRLLTGTRKIAPSSIYEEGAVVFPVLHGPMGEDGSVQGFLEVLKCPMSAAISCHLVLPWIKSTTKRVLESAGDCPSTLCIAIVEGDDVTAKIAEVEEKLTIQSSRSRQTWVQVSVFLSLKTTRNYAKALELAFQYDSRVLVGKGECS